MPRQEETFTDFMSQEFPWTLRSAEAALGSFAIAATGVLLNSEIMIDLGFGLAGGLTMLTPIVFLREKQARSRDN